MVEDIVFKAVAGEKNRGDATWIHSNGLQAVLVDGVSGADGERAAGLARAWLQENADPQRVFRPDVLLRELHELMKKQRCQAVFGTIRREKHRYHFDYVGNLQLFRLRFGRPVESFGAEPRLQPREVLGQDRMPDSEYLTFEGREEEAFILSTDGLDHQKLIGFPLDPDFIEQGGDHAAKLAPLRREDDWSALLFPVGSRLDLVQSEWPYNPFIGEQEERLHERKGLLALAKALFTDPRFDPFRILPCPPIARANSSRLFDGVLVCPLGVFPIELKDYHGEVDLYLGRDKRNSMVLRSSAGEKTESNPVTKLREGLGAFAEFEPLSDVLTEAKRTGLLLFTHPEVTVRCIGLDGETVSLPYRNGDVLICQPFSLVDILVEHAKKIFGKKLKNRLTAERVLELTDALHTTGVELKGAQPVGQFEVSDQELSDESTAYFQIFAGEHFGDPVWVKKYQLSSLSGVSRDQELLRIGRESQVLHRLSRRRIRGIPYFYEAHVKDGALYVFLEPAYPGTLEQWISEKPDRAAVLRVMRTLADIVKSIGNLTDPAVVHRAINPRNVRLDTELQVQLINFELCQLADVGTLLVDARKSFAEKYMAPEANEHGKTLTGKADVFSFMLCLHYALTGELPFRDDIRELIKLSRKPGFWERKVADMGLPESAVPLWQRGLHHSSESRPEIDEISEALDEWLESQKGV